MTKLNFMKSVILLFAVLAFSGCEENGPIQFIAVDEFEITLPIKVLKMNYHLIILVRQKVQLIFLNY